MARLARVIAVDVAHHVTQRGNGRQFILATDSERRVYRDLLGQYVPLYGLRLLGYCLMSNHVHLVVIPTQANALALALKQTHGRYASYWNAAHGGSGHVWQGRFYSCPLDSPHLWAALRYAELNPVRAGLVEKPELWAWSSAAAHCGTAEPEPWLEMEAWRRRWGVAAWREYLAAGEGESELASIRQCTHTGRPLGTPEFIQALEKGMLRRLAPQRGGRPGKPVADGKQGALGFG